MSIRESFPGDRDAEVIQVMASILASLTRLSIEPFGSDNPELAGLPERPLYPVPDPSPLTQLLVAQCVCNTGLNALDLIKVLEDAFAANKARWVARVSGAAAVEAQLLKLHPWQNGVGQLSVTTEIAMRLGIPEPTAAALAHHSTALVDEHPAVLNALEAGTLSWRHATIINDEIHTLQETASTTAEDAAALEAHMLALSENTTAASFAGKARRARERMHPETITTRTKEAFTKRNLKCEPGKDGMSWLTLHLPTISASAIYTRCTRLARSVKADASAAQRAADLEGTGQDCREYRTLEQLRADVASFLLLGQELPSNLTGSHDGVSGSNSEIRPDNNARTSEQPDTQTSTSNENAPSDVTATGHIHTNGTTLSQPEQPRSEEPAKAGQSLDSQTNGDGSGLVGYIVDGIPEDPEGEYLQQLNDLAHSKTLLDPPMPDALVIVTVPFLGLLGLSDEPAELAGRDGGPVPEAIAQKLLKNSSSFLRVLTDPITGEALPLEPQRYTLRAAEKTVLQALAGGCYVPNCPNPVMDTELDHLRAFEFGGQSTLANLSAACKRHHKMKHFKDDKDRNGRRRCIDEPERNQLKLRGWTPKLTEDGRVGWIMPSGTYQAPQNRDRKRPQYPKWLKKLIGRSLKGTKESRE